MPTSEGKGKESQETRLIRKSLSRGNGEGVGGLKGLILREKGKRRHA